MKTKLLTICLLLFTSQVFAEDIMLKCNVHVTEGSKTYYFKYSKNILGKISIKTRHNGNWIDFCNKKEHTDDDNCKQKDNKKFSSKYGECLTNYLSNTCKFSYKKISIDFLTRELTFSREYGRPRKTDITSCSRLYE